MRSRSVAHQAAFLRMLTLRILRCHIYFYLENQLSISLLLHTSPFASSPGAAPRADSELGAAGAFRTPIEKIPNSLSRRGSTA